jgi:glycosyltransferase involved in cell wall biosynthesis
MPQKIKIAINGKFFGATGTGVQRVAEQHIIEIDKLLTRNPSLSEKFDFKIYAPKNCPIHLDPRSITKENAGFLSGLFKNIPWEHICLPWLSRGRTILSLCNIGPIFSKSAIVMIHDAQYYTAPESYSLAFRLWYKLTTHITGIMSAKVLTVSEFSKEQLVKYQIAKPEKIVVVHNGCDHVLSVEEDASIFSRINLSSDEKYFIAQSQTKRYKNIAVLLNAYSTGKLNDTKLVLYGSEKHEAFEKQGYHVPPNVIFTGRVTDEELKALIQHAQATLTPSLTEGFGLQPLEGMILGTPAIVAPCGALPEVCGDAGIYADPHKPQEWVNAMRQLLDNPKPTAALKQIIKTHAQQFSWEKAAERLMKIIETAVVPQP